MEKIFRFLDLKKKELFRFLITGFTAVGTDACVYAILLYFLSPSYAKTSSFFAGTIVAYLLNKYWTFEKKVFVFKEVIRFLSLYTVTLFVNVWVNTFTLDLTHQHTIAFLFATTTSTILNFIGLKFWVFRKNKKNLLQSVFCAIRRFVLSEDVRLFFFYYAIIFFIQGFMAIQVKSSEGVRITLPDELWFVNLSNNLFQDLINFDIAHIVGFGANLGYGFLFWVFSALVFSPWHFFGFETQIV
ncbi:MAG: GtrA family protein, partial [Patescibacteria group bacterium]